MLGCAIPLAISFFLIVLAGACLDRSLAWSERLLMAGLAGGMAFSASMVLAIRDRRAHRRTRDRVRENLLQRSDQPSEEFLQAFPGDPLLATSVRESLASYFDVHAAKIHSSDEIQQHYEFTQFEPGLPFYVIDHYCEQQQVPMGHYWFSSESVEDLVGLVAEIEEVVAAFRLDADQTASSESATDQIDDPHSHE